MDHTGELPLIEGTLIRLEVDRLPGGHDPLPVWLWSSATGLSGEDVDLRWQAFLRRFDLEHTFRMIKQTLGWTRPKLRTPAAADRWTWLIIAAHTQLRLPRPLAADLRRPWVHTTMTSRVWWRARVTHMDEQQLVDEEEWADNPRLNAWIAAQAASFDMCSPFDMGGWDCSIESLDQLEDLLRGRFTSYEDIKAARDSQLVTLAAWYLGEVHIRHHGAQWQCQPEPDPPGPRARSALRHHPLRPRRRVSPGRRRPRPRRPPPHRPRRRTARPISARP